MGRVNLPSPLRKASYFWEGEGVGPLENILPNGGVFKMIYLWY